MTQTSAALFRMLDSHALAARAVAGNAPQGGAERRDAESGFAALLDDLGTGLDRQASQSGGDEGSRSIQASREAGVSFAQERDEKASDKNRLEIEFDVESEALSAPRSADEGAPDDDESGAGLSAQSAQDRADQSALAARRGPGSSDAGRAARLAEHFEVPPGEDGRAIPASSRAGDPAAAVNGQRFGAQEPEFSGDDPLSHRGGVGANGEAGHFAVAPAEGGRAVPLASRQAREAADLAYGAHERKENSLKSSQSERALARANAAEKASRRLDEEQAVDEGVRDGARIADQASLANSLNPTRIARTADGPPVQGFPETAFRSESNEAAAAVDGHGRNFLDGAFPPVGDRGQGAVGRIHSPTLSGDPVEEERGPARFADIFSMPIRHGGTDRSEEGGGHSPFGVSPSAIAAAAASSVKVLEVATHLPPAMAPLSAAPLATPALSARGANPAGPVSPSDRDGDGFGGEERQDFADRQDFVDRQDFADHQGDRRFASAERAGAASGAGKVSTDVQPKEKDPLARSAGGVGAPSPKEGAVSPQSAEGVNLAFPRSEFARVAAAIKEALAVKSGAASAPDGGALGAAPGLVRTINLELRPDTLGLIHVRMRLNGDELSLELRASRAETARLIEADSDILNDHLRGAGYDPSLLVERPRPEPASVSQAGGEGHAASGGQTTPGGAESGASWQRRGGFASAERFSGGANDLAGRGEGLAGETADPGRAGGVYL